MIHLMKKGTEYFALQNVKAIAFKSLGCSSTPTNKYWPATGLNQNDIVSSSIMLPFVNSACYFLKIKAQSSQAWSSLPKPTTTKLICMFQNIDGISYTPALTKWLNLVIFYLNQRAATNSGRWNIILPAICFILCVYQV